MSGSAADFAACKPKATTIHRPVSNSLLQNSLSNVHAHAAAASRLCRRAPLQHPACKARPDQIFSLTCKCRSHIPTEVMRDLQLHMSCSNLLTRTAAVVLCAAGLPDGCMCCVVQCEQSRAKRSCQQRRKGEVHRATAGVSASVIGARTGSSALVHRKAIARSEPLLVSAFASHPRSSASSRSSSSVRRGGDKLTRERLCTKTEPHVWQSRRGKHVSAKGTHARTRQHAILDEQALQLDLPSCRKVASCRARHQSSTDRALVEPSQACSSLNEDAPVSVAA